MGWIAPCRAPPIDEATIEVGAIPKGFAVPIGAMGPVGGLIGVGIAGIPIFGKGILTLGNVDRLYLIVESDSGRT